MGCREPILTNLSESEANRALARLEEGGYPVTKTHQADGRWGLSVEKAEAATAISYLERVRALPQERRDKEESSGFLMSRDEQRLKLQRGIAANLEQTLYTLDGVREARVHLNLPERDPLLGKELSPGSASVLIVFEGSHLVEKDDIAKLVAGAAGLLTQNVSVLAAKVDDKRVTGSERELSASGEQGDQQKSIVAEVSILPGKTPTSNLIAKQSSSTSTFDPLTEIALSLVIVGVAGAFGVLRSQRSIRSASSGAKA